MGKFGARWGGRTNVYSEIGEKMKVWSEHSTNGGVGARKNGSGWISLCLTSLVH